MTEAGNTSAVATDDKRHNLTDDEAALLEEALAISMNVGKNKNVDIADTDMPDATTEDPELARALQMSVQESAKDPVSQSDMSKVLEDPSFVSSIVTSLPGVDPNDPSLKDFLASLEGRSETPKKETDESKKDGDK
ncbi:26S proteasome non-ATPase regulatory subunit 4 homolog [Curcuma longa]|uniref:26S proteasome non-ATPase regulatory subunit 4 homolog n=1 Tax=Curcuma longa TaxID=136217 RepID=UPI003D9F56B2